MSDNETAQPVAWLQPATVDSYIIPDRFETCDPGDYAAFPVYRAAQPQQDTDIYALKADLALANETIRRLHRLISNTEGENFKLAAGQCIHDDGLTADDGGTPYCAIKVERDSLRAALAV